MSEKHRGREKKGSARIFISSVCVDGCVCISEVLGTMIIFRLCIPGSVHKQEREKNANESVQSQLKCHWPVVYGAMLKQNARPPKKWSISQLVVKNNDAGKNIHFEQFQQKKPNV